MRDLEKEAKEFAIEKHGDQMYDRHPYSFHLQQVVDIVKKSFGKTKPNPQILAAAWLHDVVEDTDVSLLDIKTIFGSTVEFAVRILTDEPGKNRKERKAKSYYKMARLTNEIEENYIPLLIKLADRLANVKYSAMHYHFDKLKMYKKEHGMFIMAVYRNDDNKFVPIMNEIDNYLKFESFIK